MVPGGGTENSLTISKLSTLSCKIRVILSPSTPLPAILAAYGYGSPNRGLREQKRGR